MNELVIIKDGKAVTDSLTVAEVFGKQHDNVMRDVRNQINKLVLADLRGYSRLNFEESVYELRGKLYTKYELTEEAFALIAMAYTTPEAMKFKVKFLQEFKRIKEQLSQPKPLSEREQLMASMKLSLELAEEFSTVKQDVTELKKVFDEELTLNHGQQQVLHHEIKKRVENIYGNYTEDITKQGMYSQIHKQLRRAFSAPKYIFVKRKDYDEAIAWVKAWRPLF
ncbi:Rha family transcriptional regulator [Priestia aryabhattai]|uniref:Rha family transcriptional regulator n=1 Tax=Priestia aryabhattai TaxID=412384 RepID=UPI0039A3BA55